MSDVVIPNSTKNIQEDFGYANNLAAALNSEVAFVNIYGRNSISFKLTIPTGATCVFEGSFDGVTYNNVTMRRVANNGYLQSTDVSDIYVGSISAMRIFRVRVSVAGSAPGTVIGSANSGVSTLEGIKNGPPNDFEINVIENKVSGYSVVNKFGRNPDVDTGSTPEDVFNGSTPYKGFPTGAPEEIQVFSSNAGDTGVLSFIYLASNTATAWETATVTLNGTTQVNTGVIAYRVHSASYNSGSPTAFNLGNITIRHRTTTANVFCFMPIAASQTYVSGYTIPAGSTGYIKRLFCRVFVNTTGQIEGALWVRPLNGAPRLRRPFSASNTDAFEEQPYGGLVIPAGADLIVRITATSSSNLTVIAGYDLILVEN